MKSHPTPTHQLLHTTLAKRIQRAQKNLSRRHPHAVTFFEKHSIENLRHHAAKIATSGALAGALFLAQPVSGSVRATIEHHAPLTTAQTQETLAQTLASILPSTIQPLSVDQEKTISELIRSTWGIHAYAVLEGEHLNHSYGLIGAEQHMPRFPGDTLAQHDEPRREGITPGLGAWGYFAPSKAQLTGDLVQKEKWYVAVQTLYLPDWNSRFSLLRDWYRYRKVILINPVNGKTVVGDIGDAGPAKWTGKHFGGSPEVMQYLGLNVGMQKGPVVLFFVDDPLNEVPLGPVEYNRGKEAPLAAAYE